MMFNARTACLRPTVAWVTALLCLLATACPLAARPTQEKDAPKDISGDIPKEIPPEKLPAATRKAPDPNKDQFLRKPVFVNVTETTLRRDGSGDAKSVVVRRYLEEYFRRAGHPIASDPATATFSVTGEVEVEFEKQIRFRGRHIAWKVRGAATFAVRDAEQKEIHRVELPEVFQERATTEEAAFHKLRRYVAKLAWDDLVVGCEPFSNAKVQDLLRRLGQQDPGDATPPTAEEVTAQLADSGLAAVPFLLEAMSDTRTVQLNSSYPGLGEHGPTALKVYHIADKALEEIFQKVSRMDLETSARLRSIIARGWEQEWQKFCKPFHDSPESERRRQRAKEAREKAERKAASKKTPTKAGSAP